jgi:nucleoside-diphosphate-sugar epimerase
VRVLVTGSSGLVGFETVELLRAGGAHEVVGVSRARSAQASSSVAWDMAAEPPPAELRRPWDVIVHAAADTRWTMAPAEAARANVNSVAALAPLVSSDTHVVHISTAYAVGLRGDVQSEQLGDYRNTYEWSKAHGERLVSETFEHFTIIRPPLIIGRREDGRAARFAGMYTVLRGITASMVPVVVADPDAYFEVVPVDELAQLIVEVSQRPAGDGVLTIAGGSRAPRVRSAFDRITSALNAWRAERGLEPFAEPRMISRESWDRFFLPFVRDQLSRRQHRVLELLSNFEPYLRLSEPLTPTHQVAGMESCIATAVRYWADTEHRQASQAPRAWKAATR